MKNQLSTKSTKNENPIYITHDELIQLQQEAFKKEKELKEAGFELGETTQQSAETWHDNAPFEATREKLLLLSKQYQEILTKLKNVIVIHPSKEKDKIVFGTKVELEINFSSKKIFTLSGISDIKNGKISITSPLGKSILGKKEGDEIHFTLGSKQIYIKVLKILEI